MLLSLKYEMYSCFLTDRIIYTFNRKFWFNMGGQFDLSNWQGILKNLVVGYIDNVHLRCTSKDLHDVCGSMMIEEKNNLNPVVIIPVLFVIVKHLSRCEHGINRIQELLKISSYHAKLSMVVSNEERGVTDSIWDYAIRKDWSYPDCLRVVEILIDAGLPVAVGGARHALFAILDARLSWRGASEINRLCKVLLRGGLDLSKKMFDRYGHTESILPFVVECLPGRDVYNLLKVFLIFNADPNASDISGNPVLNMAVYYQIPNKCVELLVSKGADPTLRSRSGHCARDMDIERKYQCLHAIEID